MSVENLRLTFLVEQNCSVKKLPAYMSLARKLSCKSTFKCHCSMVKKSRTKITNGFNRQRLCAPPSHVEFHMQTVASAVLYVSKCFVCFVCDKKSVQELLLEERSCTLSCSLVVSCYSHAAAPSYGF